MGSLIDLVDSVLHSDKSAKKANESYDEIEYEGNKSQHMSTLHILDETLKDIYTTQNMITINGSSHFQGRSSTKSLKPASQSVNDLRAEVNLKCSSSDKHTPSEDRILLKKCEKVGVSEQSASADKKARGILKTVAEEAKHWELKSGSASDDEFALYLSDKYLTGSLSKLPSTPFVQFARKKIAHRIMILKAPSSEKQSVLSKSSQDPETSDGKDSSEIRDIKEFTYDIQNVIQGLGMRFSLPQPLSTNNGEHSEVESGLDARVETEENKGKHAALDKLIKLPTKQLKKLPKHQQDLVQYAKRYKTMLEMTQQQIDSLPAQQQQMIKCIRSKLSRNV